MNSVIRIFNYNFYVKEILLVFATYLLMENIFSWLFVPVSVVVLGYEKVLSLFIYAFVAYSYLKLKPGERIYVVLFTAYMLKLMFASLFEFGHIFKQFTMFTVLYPIIFVIFIKYICRTYDLDLLEFIAKFYLLTYIVFMVIYGRNFSLSLDAIEMDDYGPFSGDGRIVHARSVFMMIIPFLWYLHQYITQRKTTALLIVLFCTFVIIMHQHRSVWSSCLLAVMVYTFISIRTNHKTLGRFASILLGTFISVALVYFFLSNMAPQLVEFLGDRFSEIFNPAKEGSTGNFRIEQRDVYFKLFLDRPFFGWTYEGFEMDNPLVDWWPKNSGQHFHETYMEMLFYHGIAGFLFKFSFLFYLLYQVFSKKLTEQTIILLSICVAGMIFAFNYVLPLIYWGHVGLCLYYIEKDKASYEERMDTGYRKERWRNEQIDLQLQSNPSNK
ncbi:O-antigen ligase family protein [Aridibaculum aurantiacum]|uniref:O-antigen ligase family protein n=1 Tax=Aridibaculum aurantiacum TaxID=2810307 RepID=UPI001A9685D6|nr:O-antigen ligase family protein [Aridibaculum aurantiacum]